MGPAHMNMMVKCLLTFGHKVQHECMVLFHHIILIYAIRSYNRWIRAMKTSIGKWLPFHQALQDYMSRPPEETKM